MFLAQLIARTLEGQSGIAPRRASRFEPEAGLGAPGWLEPEVQPASPVQAPGVLASGPEAAAVPRPRPAPPHSPGPQDVIRATEPRAPDATSPPRAPASSTTAPAPQAVAMLGRLERLPTHEPSPSVIHPPPQPPSTVPPSALRELRTLERVEMDHVPLEIERRLEVLTREHVIERIAREAAGGAPPVSVAAPRAGSTPGAEPARPRPAPYTAPPAPRGRRDPPTLTPAAPTQPPAPAIVQVTIGRVEVRGGPPASPRAAPPRPREPRLGLDDYLRRREQG
ncbi:hypothetical protein [Sabulicella glaciei]|uniref:Uncharacterized protein n=1 Tax=Sabulicella glaciei TaxID=2984948 RepID=A0ABT3NQ45_9PROT|nr:hypothetical protein [Roseococcus sp. MDT2-1-1]MCW8084281.1 hypothetical protein [Roseococcus sp. MDT2-1-1]